MLSSANENPTKVKVLHTLKQLVFTDGTDPQEKPKFPALGTLLALLQKPSESMESELVFSLNRTLSMYLLEWKLLLNQIGSDDEDEFSDLEEFILSECALPGFHTDARLVEIIVLTLQNQLLRGVSPQKLCQLFLLKALPLLSTEWLCTLFTREWLLFLVFLNADRMINSKEPENFGSFSLEKFIDSLTHKLSENKNKSSRTVKPNDRLKPKDHEALAILSESFAELDAEIIVKYLAYRKTWLEWREMNSWHPFGDLKLGNLCVRMVNTDSALDLRLAESSLISDLIPVPKSIPQHLNYPNNWCKQLVLRGGKKSFSKLNSDLSFKSLVGLSGICHSILWWCGLDLRSKGSQIGSNAHAEKLPDIVSIIEQQNRKKLKTREFIQYFNWSFKKAVKMLLESDDSADNPETAFGNFNEIFGYLSSDDSSSPMKKIAEEFTKNLLFQNRYETDESRKINRKQLGLFLTSFGGSNKLGEFSQMCLDEWLKLALPYSHNDEETISFVSALRRLLSSGFQLPGEAQMIDRLMMKFAQYYFEYLQSVSLPKAQLTEAVEKTSDAGEFNQGTENEDKKSDEPPRTYNGKNSDETNDGLKKNSIDTSPHDFPATTTESNSHRFIFKSVDEIYVLSFSILMLNTDLHNRSLQRQRQRGRRVGRKLQPPMTVDQFIQNNRGMAYGGLDFPQEFLREIYHDIQSNELKLEVGNEEDDQVDTKDDTDNVQVSPTIPETANEEEIIFPRYPEHARSLMELVWMPILSGLSKAMQQYSSDVEIRHMEMSICFHAIKCLSVVCFRFASSNSGESMTKDSMVLAGEAFLSILFKQAKISFGSHTTKGLSSADLMLTQLVSYKNDGKTFSIFESEHFMAMMELMKVCEICIMMNEAEDAPKSMDPSSKSLPTDGPGVSSVNLAFGLYSEELWVRVFRLMSQWDHFMEELTMSISGGEGNNTSSLSSYVNSTSRQRSMSLQSSTSSSSSLSSQSISTSATGGTPKTPSDGGFFRNTSSISMSSSVRFPVTSRPSSSSVSSVRQSTKQQSSALNSYLLEQVKSQSQMLTVEMDRLFQLSTWLSGRAILQFVKALCRVSMEEISSLSFREPRMYTLMKLVEISFYNMDRIKLEWSNIWQVLGAHFNRLGCISGRGQKISIFAIDQLRQLSMKFLSAEELPNFKFQQDFLRPFEFIIKNNPDPMAKDLVIQSIRQLVLSHSDNLKSGWRAVYQVIGAACAIIDETMKEEEKDSSNYGQTNSESIFIEAFQLLRLIHQSYFKAALIDNNCFGDHINCLVEFCKKSGTKHMKIGLQSIEMLGCKENSNDSIMNDYLDLTSQFDWNDGDAIYQAWFPLLFGLYEIVMNCELEVRSKGLNYLFGYLTKYGVYFPVEFWNVIAKGVLFPIFDDLRIGGSEKRKYRNRDDLTIWLNTTLIQALRCLVDLLSVDSKLFEVKLSKSVLFDGFLDLIAICFCVPQESELIAKVGGSSLLQFIDNASLNNDSAMLHEVHWDKICSLLERIFEEASAKKLSDEQFVSNVFRYFEGIRTKPHTGDNFTLFNGGPESTKSASPNYESENLVVNANDSLLPIEDLKAEFQSIIIKSVIHLILINTVNDLLGGRAFEKQITSGNLKNYHVIKILECLFNSYTFATSFNSNSKFRMALYKIGFMTQLPNLLKQETIAALTFVQHSFDLINNQVKIDSNCENPEHIDPMIEGLQSKVIALCGKILLEFSEIDGDSKPKSIHSWSPVIEIILTKIEESQQKRFQLVIGKLFSSLLELVKQPNLGSSATNIRFKLFRILNAIDSIWHITEVSKK